MSSPFKKISKPRPDRWIGRLSFPNGHDLREWRGGNGQRCESLVDAEQRKASAIGTLENGTAAHAVLAQTYEQCWDEEPCGHQLEPWCARRLRINFVGRASKALVTHCGDQPLWSVTLVLEEGKFAPGALHEASLEDFRNVVRRKLAKVGLKLLKIIGGTDISYNENSEGTWDPHWQLHVHGIVAGSTKAELDKRLKKVFPKTATIRKPVEVVPVTDLMGALSYCCKSYFERRVSYIDAKGHWNARGDLPLKPEQFREVSLFIASQRVSSRFLFQGFIRRGRFLEPTS